MNKVILMGRLTRNPEIRYTQTNKAVCTFTLAIDRPKSGNQPKSADFISCVAWEKTGELINQYVGKGNQLLVEGRLQVRKYTDQSGKDRYITEVIVDRMEFISNNSNNQNEGQSTQSGGFHGDWGSSANAQNAGDDDIPF